MGSIRKKEGEQGKEREEGKEREGGKERGRERREEREEKKDLNILWSSKVSDRDTQFRN